MAQIDRFAVEKVLLDRLNTIETASLPVVPQGSTGAPTDGTQYIREAVLTGNGFAMDRLTGMGQEGIYQIDVLTPKSSGKWVNLALAKTVGAIWMQSETLTHSSGQTVKIKEITQTNLREEGSYWVRSVDVRFFASA